MEMTNETIVRSQTFVTGTGTAISDLFQVEDEQGYCILQVRLDDGPVVRLRLLADEDLEELPGDLNGRRVSFRGLLRWTYGSQSVVLVDLPALLVGPPGYRCGKGD
jgi:hypothetical protein